MYPTLWHLPSLPISLSLPRFVFIMFPLSDCHRLLHISTCLDFHFSYFTHFFAHKCYFPLMPLVSTPSIIQCVANYFPIILNTSMYSHWLSNSEDIVVFFYYHLHLKGCWMLKIPDEKQSLSLQFCSVFCVGHFDVQAGKYQIKSTSRGLGIYWYNRLFQIAGYSHFHHLHHVVDYLYSCWIARQGNK